MTTPQGPAAGDAYDRLPYPSHPFSHTHPDRLHVIGRLIGLDPAPVDGCRVLELGCAAGGNLIPLALELPGRFVGVDASRVQIEEGQRVLARLGVRAGVELVAADLLAVTPQMLGEFDYVICHGVYSWVPPAVQRQILALARGCLAPRGVAYVSYNTYPGWHLRAMIRDMCRYHARQFDEPLVAVEQARRLLEFLSRSASVERGAYALLLQEELRVLATQSDSYLFHEHLEEHNEPLYFHELVARAGAAGLRYLGEASPGETLRTLRPQDLGEDGARGSPAAVQAEQYRDFVLSRRFRTSLFLRDDAPVPGAALAERVAGLFVAGRATPHEGPTPPDDAPGPFLTLGPSAGPDAGPPRLWRTRWGGVMRSSSPGLAAVLDRLEAAWPQVVRWAEVEALAADHGLAAPDLAEALLVGFGHDVLELRPRRLEVAPRVAERPRSSDLVRLQLEDPAREVVSSQRHEMAQTDRFDRSLLRALDGTRDAAGLVEAAMADVAAGRLRVAREDGVVPEGDALREVLAEAVGPRLQRLLERSLLIA